MKTVRTCFGLLISSVLVFAAGTGVQAAQTSIRYEQGRLSVDVHSEPFFAVLQKIAVHTGVQFYIAEDVKAREISLFVNREPLQQALRTVLKDYSFAMRLKQTEQGWQVGSVKVYTRGAQGGVLKPLQVPHALPVYAQQDENKHVFVSSTRESITYGNLKKRGILQPSRTLPLQHATPQQCMQNDWFRMKKQFEKHEIEAYQDLLFAQNRLNTETDPAKHSALQALYTQKMEQFYIQKQTHMNRVEAIKRIGIFQKASRPDK